MFRKSLSLIFLLGILGPSVLAQEEPVAPIPPKRTRAAKIGAFGGYTPGWLFLNVDPINAFLQPAGGAALNDDGLFLSGGAGAAYIMIVPNLRVGGLGMGGSIHSTALSADGIRRDAELFVGFGGVTVEYVIPVVERLDVAVGTMLGGGGIDLTLRQDTGGPKTWLQEWDSFRTGSYSVLPQDQIRDITRTLSGSFFIYVPSVNVEYALLGWMGVRLGASYVGMAAPSWKLDNRYELLGVPTDVHGRGFMVNAGILVGTF
jgi:hypothetical protein